MPYVVFVPELVKVFAIDENSKKVAALEELWRSNL